MQIILIIISTTCLLLRIPILPKMSFRLAENLYALESIELKAGDTVILNGCITVTNDAGYVVGWGVAIKEEDAGIISPRQTRNVTPSMHHDSQTAMAVFRADHDGWYKFSMIIWSGSTRTRSGDNDHLKIEQLHYGQLVAQVIR